MSRLRALAPAAAKRFAWNVRYSLIGYPFHDAPTQTVSYLIPRLSHESSLLDLGCGNGSLLRGLRKAGWHGFYRGVDISQEAIQEAMHQSDPRASWTVAGIEDFQSAQRWDVICMIESIYYVRQANVRPLMLRCKMMLRERGFMILRIHDLEKHRGYVDLLRGMLPGMAAISASLFLVQ